MGHRTCAGAVGATVELDAPTGCVRVWGEGCFRGKGREDKNHLSQWDPIQPEPVTPPLTSEVSVHHKPFVNPFLHCSSHWDCAGIEHVVVQVHTVHTCHHTSNNEVSRGGNEAW